MKMSAWAAKDNQLDKTLEQLQKNVKDAEDAFIATDAQDAAGQVTAIDAWFLARYHLSKYWKEQQSWVY